MWGYQSDDKELIDYDLHEIDGLRHFGRAFRGPVPDRSQGFIACVGAAQTFGRFCTDPFPKILGQELGTDTMNLGVGGAGPEFFLRSDVQSALSGARLCIVQVMSGRSQTTNRFRTEGNMYGVRSSDGQRMSAEEFFEDVLLTSSRLEVQQVITEFRTAFATEMRTLLESFDCPTILLWFSTRTVDYAERFTSVDDLLGDFPQLVNRETLSQISPYATRYVECVTTTGLPHPLLDVKGFPASIELDYRLLRPRKYIKRDNTYYPSPQMHQEAARQLAPVCRELLEGGRSAT